MIEFGAILRKEFIHIFRDKITLFLVLSIPIVLVILFGFTISNEIHNAKIAVIDLSNDSQSKSLINKISASGYFRIVSYPQSEVQIDRDFKGKNVKMAVVIPAHFEEDLINRQKITIQIINDASDLNIALILSNYMQSVLNDFSAEYNQPGSAALPFEVATKMQYNPEGNSIYMFIPGIIALIMIIVTALMASITLSREMETGSMQMLLITPVKKIYVIVGKIIPYMILSFICTLLILVISYIVFKMPINGNIALLLLLCVIFMLTSASFGLMISTFVNSQLEAMLATMMLLFLPTVLLSGFLFPIENMYYAFQLFSHIIPAKWFIIAIKDIMIKGSGIAEIWEYLVILSGMSIVLIAASLTKLNKRE